MAQYSTKSADPHVILDLKVNAADAISAIIKAKEQIAALKEEQKQLEAELKKGTGTKEMKERLVLINTEIKDLNTVMKANQRELDNNVKAYKQNGDSINAYRAQLKNLRQSYEDLSKADRDSAVGQKMLSDIDSLTKEIKQLEAQQGDFSRSVGSYGKLFDTTADQMQSFGSVLASVFGQNSVIGKAATVVTGFGKSLNDMSKQITDMAKTAESSSKSVTDLGTSIDNTAFSTDTMNKAMESTSTVVQGFGAAERAAADAAKGMATNEAAAAVATEKTAAASGAATTATTGLGKGFKAASQGALQLSKQMLKLMANPFVAAITAIVLILVKLVEQFKKNDQAMTELQSAMNAFRPILDLVNKGFQFLVGIVTKAIAAIGNVVKAVTKAIPFLKKYAEQEEDIVRSTDALEDAEREFAINSAKRQSEISELRNKSTESEKYSYAERRKFLEDAMELEKQEIEEKRSIAKESVRIAEQKALNEIGYTEMTAEAWEKLSDEQKNHITELRANVIALDGEFADSTRRMTSQLNSFDKEEKEAAKQRAKAAADAAKERKKNEETAYRAMQDAYVKSIQDAQAKAEAEIRNSYARQIEDLKTKLTTEKNLTVTAKKYINQQIILLEADLQVKLGDLQKQYSEQRVKEELARKQELYTEILQTAQGMEKETVEIELVKLSNETVIQTLDATLEKVTNAKNAIHKDVEELSDEEIKIKYGVDYDRAKLKELEDQYAKDEKATAEYVAKMKEAIAKKEQLAITRITREGINAREALAQEKAELLSEIETQTGLGQFWNNEVEKTKILETQAQKRLDIAKKNLDDLKNYTEEEQIAIYGSQEAYENAVLEATLNVTNAENDLAAAARDTATAFQAQQDKIIDTFSEISGAINDTLGSFQSIFETLAESDEKYKKYSTALAMTQILVSSAISIAKAVQAATDAGGFTGPAAPVTIPTFIAQLVAIVTAGIASAVSILKKAQSSAPAKPKFASGGLVGSHPTTRKDDTVDAKLSEGEYVIQSKVVKELGVDFFDKLNGKKLKKLELPFRFANGGVVPSMTTVMKTDAAINMDEMRQVFKDAVSEIQPVVSVREINNMQTRVSVKEQTATYN